MGGWGAKHGENDEEVALWGRCRQSLTRPPPWCGRPRAWWATWWRWVSMPRTPTWLWGKLTACSRMLYVPWCVMSAHVGCADDHRHSCLRWLLAALVSCLPHIAAQHANTSEP